MLGRTLTFKLLAAVVHIHVHVHDARDYEAENKKKIIVYPQIMELEGDLDVETKGKTDAQRAAKK